MPILRSGRAGWTAHGAMRCLAAAAIALSLLQAEAQADACASAISRFNAAANNSNFQYVARFRQLFGREPSAATGYRLPDECRQTLAILRWRRGVQLSVLQLERASHAACRSINEVTGAAPAGINANMSAATLLAAIENDLAVNVALCQQGGPRPSVATPTANVTAPAVRTPTVNVAEPTVRRPTPRTHGPAVRTPRVTTRSPKVETPTVRP